MRLAHAALVVGLAAACVADEAAHPGRGCGRDADCGPGQACYLGFCVVDDAGAARDAGPIDGGRTDGGRTDGGPDGGPPPDAGECVTGDTEACYEGDPGTEGVGACVGGLRACEAGWLGACEGQVLPVAEACNGVDDDCDGSVDEGFSLQTDPMHCGECGTVCPAGWSCCSGTCRNVTADRYNCGGCGIECSPPMHRCCSSHCASSC